MSRALAMLKLGPRDAKVAQALTMVDDAADAIDADPIEDFYIRALITGTLTGLHAGGYHLGRSETLNAAGLPGQALAELNQVRQLRQGKTYSGDETRYQAWFDLLMSETYMNLGDYPEATARAKNALVTFHLIHSPRNMASIKDIQSRLALSSYGKSIDVKELNDMLQEWYKPE